MEKHYDAVIIGAGHNGLTCAAYLARAGYSVHVVERRPVIGGAALTEEFHPGFSNSVFSYLLSMLHPDIIRDLELEDKHGLEILERAGGGLSLLDKDYFYLSRDGEKAKQSLARFSQRDAELLDEYEEQLAAIAENLRAIAFETPPNLGGGWRDLMAMVASGNRLRKLPSDLQGALAELMTMSVGDYLDRWFESDAIKGLFGFEGVIGNFAAPYHPGTAYVLLHHYLGEIKGKTGAWALVKGGMGAIPKAIASYCSARGVTIETSAPVSRLLLDGNEVTGVQLEDGREIRAKTVAGNCHPQVLLGDLLGYEKLPGNLQRRMRGYRSESATFRMNLALAELPDFAALPSDPQERFTMMDCSIDICPSLDYIQQAYDDARSQGWAKNPIISMNIASMRDDSLAPEGQHVMSLFCQHFRRELPDGRSWDAVKEEVADLIVDRVAAHAPNLKQSILGRQINSPLDIERKLNMVGGDIFHGALHLDQLYSLRPAPGYAAYRMPVKGLYLCGSGAHPGGGVSGMPGRNAAQEMAKDLRKGLRGFRQAV